MNIYIDGHCDTLQISFDEKNKINNKKYCFNTTDAKTIAPVIQMAAAFINPKYQDGFERANNIIDYYLENKEDTIIIKSKKDIETVIKNKKIGIILTIENGKAIENDINNIDILYNKGIRAMSINWNEDNLLGTGALTKSNKGLTELGKKYLKKLEEKNIIIDISHSSEQTFWDAIKCTTKTIVATHSCCHSLCNHPRNLKDNQIKEIAKRAGIVGICFCSPFLTQHGKANATDIIKHISHIIQLVGEDYVGIGTDFDGVDEEQALSDIKRIYDMNILVNELKKCGYQESTINKIMGENWLRVIHNNIL
ncbi:MAG: dipeptidase [Clostridia bacterium]|nr:dipeptidase [Clostridia bacterium]